MTVHLSILVWLPLAGAVLGLLAPSRMAKPTAVATAALTLAYAIVALARFDSADSALQFVTNEMWIRELGIHYKLGVDGLNLFLILLTVVVFLACIAWAAMREWDRPKLFFFWLGLAQSAVLGSLMAQDLALFVVFFDLMLVPFLFLTGGWGGKNRINAILKLFIYTLAGSLLMLAAAIATGVMAPGSGLDFQLSALAQTPLSKGTQQWIFLFFAAAFLVKMPAFPFHGWMPDGYRAMPLPVLAVFSAVLSKVAAYGFLRISLPLFPDAAVEYQELMMLLALASILYGSAMAFTTTDARLVLGYSSIAQLGFIVLGVFALRDAGAQGAVIQAVNHGLVVAPALLILGLLAARAGGSEDLRDMGGIAFRAPVLATLLLIVMLANLAMPGSANFVGEILILLGAFQSKVAIAVIAFAGVAMAAAYSLRLFIGAMHNRVGPRVQSREIALRDAVVIVPLVVTIIAFALYPQLALSRGEGSINQAIAGAKAKTAPVQEAAR